MKRVAVIGCGAIGGVLARAIDRREIEAELVALMDIRPEACLELAGKLAGKPLVTSNLEELLSSNPDIVVEAASQEAVRDYAERVLERSDLVVLSVGALLDAALLSRLLSVASRTGRRVYVPSGAVGGIDVLRAYARAGITRLKLTTRKPPKTLGVEGVKAPVTVFRGKASEAVKAYPKSLNVAATLSLAAGVEAEVEVVADPGVDRNIHEIEAESPAGRLKLVLENLPSPENPRTSYLAALSALSLLRSLCSRDLLLVVG